MIKQKRDRMVRESILINACKRAMGRAKGI